MIWQMYQHIHGTDILAKSEILREFTAEQMFIQIIVSLRRTVYMPSKVPMMYCLL